MAYSQNFMLFKNYTIPILPKIIQANTANVGITAVHIPTSIYDSLCVNQVTPSNVITAPLCGRVSNPPQAIAAILCNTSGFIPNA